MTSPLYSPTHQIEEGIIAQLQAYSPLIAIISPARIRTVWNNRADGTSGAGLCATNIMVSADDDGEDAESIAIKLVKFQLAVMVITSQDCADSELVAPLTIPHLLHEAICGELWYAWFQGYMTQPTITGMRYAVTGPGRAARWMYKGRGEGATDAKWFADTYLFEMHYVRDSSWPPVTT